MVPSESLLAEPSSVTAAPEITVWLEPALAVGRILTGGDAGGGDELPPPQPQSSRASRAEVDRPGRRFGMSPYTQAERLSGSPGLSQCGAKRPCLTGNVRAITGGGR